MRDYTKLKTSVWHSEKFQKLSDQGKLFYLYVIGSPNVNSAGYYKLKIGYAMADLSWNEKKILDAVSETVSVKLLKFEKKEQVVLIERHFDINPPTNPKHASKVLSDILSIPYTAFRDEVLFNFSKCLKNQKWELPPKSQEILDSLSIAPLSVFLKTETERETETETETETTITIKKTNTKKNHEPFVLPEWITTDLWDEYLAHRKKKKSPMTDYAQKCAVADLKKLRAEGHDPTAVINQTIVNGWTGFFPLKNQKGANHARQSAEDRELQEFLDRPRN